MTTELATAPTFDPVWETEIYAQGQCLNKYPYDIVVSFVFRHFPRDKPRGDVRILEIGCGAGNNLLFAAAEGFQVAGLDGSRSAVDHARRRFAESGLVADLRVGDFTQLPFDDAAFDLVVDRGALVCTGLSSARRAAAEVRRVLKIGGKFLFNPYSAAHTSASGGTPIDDGLVIDIRRGSLVGCGQLCFYRREDVDAVAAAGWRVVQWEHMEATDQARTPPEVHAEWRVILQKVAG